MDKDLDARIAEAIGSANSARPYEGATCEELDAELESLFEALHDAPPDRKPRIIAAIAAVQAERKRKGC